MGFFDNLFGNAEDYACKEEQRELARQEREQAIKAAQKKAEENTPIYQVGTTEDGLVTLRIDQFGTWLSMSNDGVDMLIRMLQAAKSLPVETTGEKE